MTFSNLLNDLSNCLNDLSTHLNNFQQPLKHLKQPLKHFNQPLKQIKLLKNVKQQTLNICFNMLSNKLDYCSFLQLIFILNLIFSQAYKIGPELGTAQSQLVLLTFLKWQELVLVFYWQNLNDQNWYWYFIGVEK